LPRFDTSRIPLAGTQSLAHIPWTTIITNLTYCLVLASILTIFHRSHHSLIPPRAIDFHSRCRSPTTKSNFTLLIHLWMSKTLPLYAILKFQFKLQPSLLIKNTNQYFFPCQAGLDTKVGYITLATVHLFRFLSSISIIIIIIVNNNNSLDRSCEETGQPCFWHLPLTSLISNNRNSSSSFHFNHHSGCIWAHTQRLPHKLLDRNRASSHSHLHSLNRFTFIPA
jgi:hypothetical protein